MEELGGAGLCLGGRQGPECPAALGGVSGIPRTVSCGPSSSHSVFLDVNILISRCITAILIALQ